MISFGGGQKNPVNARPQQRAQYRFSPGFKAIQNLAECLFEIKEGIWPFVDRSQGIHQHYLPNKPGKMIAEKWANDNSSVRFNPPAHHRPKRAGRWRSLG